jgi:hypothetical protein
MAREYVRAVLVAVGYGCNLLKPTGFFRKARRGIIDHADTV